MPAPKFYLSKRVSHATRTILHPKYEEVLVNCPDQRYFEPLISFCPRDIGVDCPEPVLHFIATPIEIEWIEFKILEDGKYELMVDEDNPDEFEDLDEFDSGEEEFEEFETGYAEWELVEKDWMASEEKPVELRTGYPKWLQSSISDGDGTTDDRWGETIFVAQLESYWHFGNIYLYYDPKERKVIQINQCT